MTHLASGEADWRRHVGDVEVDEVLLQEGRDGARVVLHVHEEAVVSAERTADVEDEQFVGRLLVRRRHHGRLDRRQDELVGVHHEGAREGRLGRQVGEGAADLDGQVDVLLDRAVRLHRVEHLDLERQVVDFRRRRVQVFVLTTTTSVEYVSD